MADFYLDKGHFITARRGGPAFFDEDDAWLSGFGLGCSQSELLQKSLFSRRKDHRIRPSIHLEHDFRVELIAHQRCKCLLALFQFVNMRDQISGVKASVRHHGNHTLPVVHSR